MPFTHGPWSFIALVTCALAATQGSAVWPPREARTGSFAACDEILFWEGVEARTLQASLKALGTDPLSAELAELAADLDEALKTHPHLRDIDSFLAAVHSGMSPEFAFQTLAVGGKPKVAEFDMAVSTSGQAAFKNQSYANVVEPWYEPNLATGFFHARGGWFPAGSELFVPVVSGAGADYSHSGSNLSLLNLLMSAKSGGILGAIKADPHFTRVAAFSFDLPNSGSAFPSASFGKDLTTNLFWLRSALSRPAPFWPKEKGRPLFVPISRSASPPLVMEMHQRSPDFLGGMIHTSPLHPSDLAAANRTLAKMISDKVFMPNFLALSWVDDLYAQMEWHKQEDPFKNDTPVLILVGSEDPEETQAQGEKVGWKIYREWERKFPHKVRFIIVPGAGHDLFATRDKTVLLRVMRYVHRFFRFVLNGEKDLAAAFPVESDEPRD